MIPLTTVPSTEENTPVHCGSRDVSSNHHHHQQILQQHYMTSGAAVQASPAHELLLRNAGSASGASPSPRHYTTTVRLVETDHHGWWNACWRLLTCANALYCCGGDGRAGGKKPSQALMMELNVEYSWGILGDINGNTARR